MSKVFWTFWPPPTSMSTWFVNDLWFRLLRSETNSILSWLLSRWSMLSFPQQFLRVKIWRIFSLFSGKPTYFCLLYSKNVWKVCSSLDANVASFKRIRTDFWGVYTVWHLSSAKMRSPVKTSVLILCENKTENVCFFLLNRILFQALHSATGWSICGTKE